MGLTAKIHSKTLQIIVSREQLVNLAHNGAITFPLQDVTNREFGTVHMSLSSTARRAIFEHLDIPCPGALIADSEQEIKLTGKGKI